MLHTTTNTHIKYYFILLLIGISLSSIAQEQTKFKEKTDFQFTAGLNRGFGLGVNLLFNDPAKEFPLDIRLGLGYTWLKPGSSSAARKIFINNASNGVPEEKGHNIDLRLDFLKKITILDNQDSYGYFGPRYSSFKGNFKYVGGNEDFDITTKQYGLGAGIESRYNISSNVKLVVSAGLDYFFDAKLQGHDTSYSPNNDNTNARTNNSTDEQFRYKDADKAIDQPGFMPRIMFGVQMDL